MKSNLNKVNIKKIVDNKIDWIYSEDGSFGLWIIGLWLHYNELNTIEEIKEAFFYALERLLTEKKLF